MNQLQTGLHQQIPNLNDSANEHMTLLDFATNQAKTSSSPSAILCLDLLMAKGATIENADTLHRPSHFLAIDGEPALLEWFLKKGANPNAKDSPHGKPILFEALYLSSSDQYKATKIALLLAYGADPNATPPHDELAVDTSPLLYAADNELWDVCQLLLDKGADPAYKTHSGLTVQAVMNYKEKSYTEGGKTPPTELIMLKERINALLAKAY
ncbi:hypothetical protein GO730_15285 [Spirosoma sp. HMF3257]|uniref:Uncharacterized protein n=1 Tax=Spirosoma telluris TaxID=2183553 RepID=A0A327NIK5_9BACT|nr:hypothetical protein [Spirosoma telluris]RAI75211.1 hypothetical protein HMF3257_15230 [Spirosoma telluris]